MSSRRSPDTGGERAAEEGQEEREQEEDREGEALNVREEVSKHRGRIARAIEATSKGLSHPATLFGLVGLHAAWIVLNSGLVPGVVVWDPYPFTFLATVASVEAPFLTILVLMGQHRESRINELRDEVTLQVAFQSEKKASAALRLLLQQAKGRGLEQDELDHMSPLEHALDADELLASVQQHLEQAEGKEPGMSPDQ